MNIDPTRSDDQLSMAIQKSLQDGGGETEGDQKQEYHKTSADLTVDYFLKSLAGNAKSYILMH